jgi:NADH-quinone oxidoreductase subunit J
VLQILVYAGAIMMLFLFVIMLLNLKNEDEPPHRRRNIRRIAALMFAVFLAQASIVAYPFAGM